MIPYINLSKALKYTLQSNYVYFRMSLFLFLHCFISD